MDKAIIILEAKDPDNLNSDYKGTLEYKGQTYSIDRLSLVAPDGRHIVPGRGNIMDSVLFQGVMRARADAYDGRKISHRYEFSPYRLKAMAETLLDDETV